MPLIVVIEVCIYNGREMPLIVVIEVCIYNGREMPLITVMLQRCVFTMVESTTRGRGGKMAASTTVCVKMKSQAHTNVKKGIYIICSSAKY